MWANVAGVCRKQGIFVHRIGGSAKQVEIRGKY